MRKCGRSFGSVVVKELGMFARVYQTLWFVVLAVAPKMYQVHFNFEKLSMFTNAQSVLVRLGVLNEPEQLATAFLFCVSLLMLYWASLVFALATGDLASLPNECVSVDALVTPPPYKCTESFRNIFVHGILPLDTCILCWRKAHFTLSRQREAIQLTCFMALAFGLIQVLRPMSPPLSGTFVFVAPTTDPLGRRLLYLLLAVPTGLMQWGLHAGYRRLYARVCF